MTYQLCTLDHVDSSSAAHRFRLALDMYEVGGGMQRQRLRRQWPDAALNEIEAEVVAWRTGRSVSPARPLRQPPPPLTPGNLVVQILRAIAHDLVCSGHAWALVGDYALSARAEPRFGSYVHVAVAVPDDDAGRLIHSLVSCGYRLVASPKEDTTGRLATARLVSAVDAEIVVDLLFASSGIEPEIVAAAEWLEILPELPLPVAQVGHLIALKLIADDDWTRPQDLADARALLRVATSEDLRMARDAIGLISARGFDRGRDRAAALAELLA
jgi:hypothetical protein